MDAQPGSGIDLRLGHPVVAYSYPHGVREGQRDRRLDPKALTPVEHEVAFLRGVALPLAGEQVL